ncbi:hypothetical protein [Tatumella sp. UBA2305]|uniref:hypothetical protein n=1 Tax=Tatumella sp. UBA2305 TaxID=1947647 RepID=UPI0025E8FA1D|nr:hypothetical protein [Tatumella sp. UBA2305]
MSLDHTLEQVAEMAEQAETILLMWERIDTPLCESEAQAILTLLRRLTGNVSSWLIEERVDKERGQ